MAQAKRNKQPQGIASLHLSRGLREGSLFVLGAIGAYLLICLASYSTADPGWSHSGSADSLQNSGGIVGAVFADVFLYLFGLMAYLFPLAVIYSGWILFHGREHAEEAFHRGIVCAAADRTHAADQVVAFQEALVLATGKLAASV